MKVFPDLKAHVQYVNDAYNLAFRIQAAINGKRLTDISDVARAQFMILMRITDFLRCILKHTFGRRLRAAVVSFEDRQDLLGHKSQRITAHYSHPELSNLIAAAEKACG